MPAVSSLPKAPPFPRAPLLGAGALVGMSLLVTAAVRLTGGATMVPSDATVVAERNLSFADRLDGAISVTEQPGGRVVAELPPQSNNFLRATMRGLAQQRKREGTGPEQPFRLTAWSDNRITLDDPITGRHVELEAFGPTNEESFARLLAAPGNAP